VKKYSLVIIAIYLPLICVSRQAQEPAAQKTVTASIEVRIPLEEKLLATIPKEYKEPGDYEQIYPGNAAAWAVFSGVGFGRPGRGWEPVFSPDYSRFAYRAKMGKKEFIVIGETKGPEFDEVRYAVFSPDGSKIAYAAKLNKKWFIVSGDEKSPEYDRVGPPVFSADGSRLAYSAESAKKEFIVVDGQKGPEFYAVSSPTFSPDGKTVAFVTSDVASQGKKLISSLYVGGKKLAEHPTIGDVTFAPDGKVAYVAGDVLENMYMVVGDKKEREFDAVFAPTFSRDGRKVAYLALKKSTLKRRLFVVSGDYRGPEYSDMSPPIFTPDGNKVAYIAGQPTMSRSGKFFIFIGDKQTETKCLAREDYNIILFTGIDERPKMLAISPDGSKTACKSADVGFNSVKWQIEVSNYLGPKFDDVGRPIFSNDGSKVAYWARKGRELWWKVMEVQ